MWRGVGSVGDEDPPPLFTYMPFRQKTNYLLLHVPESYIYTWYACVYYTSSVPVLLPYPREMLVIEMHAVWSQTIVRQRRDVLQYVRVVRISITRYHQVWFDDPKKYLV